MNINRLIDFMGVVSDKAGSKAEREEVKKTIKSLMTGERFYFPDVLGVACLHDRIDNLPFQNLPYAACVFELTGFAEHGSTKKVPLIARARQEGDRIRAEIFAVPAGTSLITPLDLDVVFEADDDGRCLISCDANGRYGNLFLEVPYKNGETTADENFHFYGVMLSLYRAIEKVNDSNIKYVEREFSVKVNQKRRKKGKPPLLSYKVLELKTDKVVAVGEPHGTHASPRVHLRRGHYRNLKNGIKAWVKACVVGDKTKGLVKKDYMVGC